MKIKYALWLFFLVPMMLCAQDNILMTDGNLKNGKIISEEGSFVKYVDADGNVFSVKKDYIKEIHYQNPPKTAGKRFNSDANRSLSIFSADILAIFYGNIAVSFQKISQNGHFGFRLPISFYGLGFDPPFTYTHLFQGGVDFNYYPSTNGIVKYFVGPALRVGSIKADRSLSDFFGYSKPTTSGHFTMLLNNGVMRNSVKGFSMSFLIGVGFRSYSQSDFSDTPLVLHAEFTLGRSF